MSEILQKVGLAKDWTGTDPFYAQRGKAVHLAIQYFLEHRLDESSLDPVIIPYFQGFKKYYAEHPMGITRCEVMGSFSNEWAGTIDCITENEIIDWKCSKSHDKVAELQGQAYKLLECQMLRTPLRFRVVQFPGDGSYEVFDYGNHTHLWLSVMDLYRWKIGK